MEHQLVDEEWVTPGLLGDRGREWRRHRAPAAQELRRERATLGQVERAKLDRGHGAPRLDETRERIPRRGPLGEDEEHPRRAVAHDEKREERDALRIDPLSVVDVHDERARHGEPGQQIAEREEGQAPRLLGVLADDVGAGGAAELGDRLEDRKHVPEEGRVSRRGDRLPAICSVAELSRQRVDHAVHAPIRERLALVAAAREDELHVGLGLELRRTIAARARSCRRPSRR